jgi:RNA-directed DNA polymerase
LIAFLDISESFFNLAYWKKGQDKYTKRTINKATGKPRTIHIPSKRLKIIQRIALKKLQSEKKFQPRSHAHGFAQGKSIITNAACHVKSKRIIKMDLKDFFHSIHFGRVRGMFMSYPFEFGDKAATIMAQLSCLDERVGVLPQGGPLSPYIANMMCRRLDKRLAEVARSHRCHFTRYADDITFSTNDISQDNINDLIKEASSIVESEGFIVNNDKTKILTPEERQVVTGIIINDGINVNRRYVRNLRATLKNCKKDGIDSQIDGKIFRDNRSSRPNHNASNYHPSKGYFLRHLLGKINFYGDVVLSNKQDDINKNNSKLFKRIQTYENILYTFYKLINSPQERKNIDKSLFIMTKDLLNKRPNLVNKLSLHNKIDGIRALVRKDFRDQTITKERLDELDSINDLHRLDLFVDELKKDDPRIYSYYNRMPSLEASKINLKELLRYPPISLTKTRILLKSLKEGQLKKLVHNDPISVKDCYAILCDNYESVFYYLPSRLKEEFEAWKTCLNDVLSQEGESYRISDSSVNSILMDATNTLKKNTRFGRSAETSSNLVNKIQSAIKEISTNDNLANDRVELLFEGSMAFYTHVPSVFDIIKYVLDSMLKNSNQKNKIFIDIHKSNRRVELRIFDKSQAQHRDIESNRLFVNGKLREVIELTNGLCEYWIEAGPKNRDRKIINMHKGISVKKEELSELNQGFVHRFRFEK